MHHQVVVLASEIGTAVTINSLQWHKFPTTDQDANCANFSIYMGLCATDQLSGDSFEGNYITGTKTLVYSSALQVVSASTEWPEIGLATPFFYNGTDNLIIEIQWEDNPQPNLYYNWVWFAGDSRCIYAQGSPEIKVWNSIPHMNLIGTEALENSTFAQIKVELGQ